MAPKNARLPLPHPQPTCHPPFAPSGIRPPYYRSFTLTPMAFRATASRTLARNIGVNVNNPSSAMDTFVMEPIHVWYSCNILSDGSQTKLTAAARHSTPSTGRLNLVIRIVSDLDWILHWVEDHNRPEWRMADLWMQPAPVWSIQGFPDAETHDELSAGAGYFEPDEDQLMSPTHQSEMDMGVYESYESGSMTYGSEMEPGGV
ncbi:hypothetical protein E4U40_006312 [Claviceps sp. LM458 group G5]|nr:hypothetical protein E4U40_006312 [Claviceps sp. LM458 group G5]